MSPKDIRNSQGEFISELDNKDFRVVVFGSARIKPGDAIYDQVYNIGKAVGAMGADIITGGGPGLMEAANKGHMDGKVEGSSNHSIGVGIKLPFEESLNKHIELKDQHEHFSTRLDTFMELSNIVVVAPGGIGTLLELSYTWQLIQVGHICKTPIILVGKMWKDLIQWVKREMVAQGLVSPEDLDVIHIVKNEHEAIALIKETKDMFEDGCYDACLNWDKYKQAVKKFKV
jgi:uncharacterized protein (TIGR00730 family)